MNGEGLNNNGELLLYAYVDSQNKRSKRLIDEYGFRQAGSFNVIPFSRLFPKNSQHMQICDGSREDMILSALKTYYHDFQLVSFENLFKKGSYFYMMDKSAVVCGVQAHMDQWDIVDMPGFGGRILMQVVPKVPIVKRLFSPAYRFVLLELAFCLEGYEHLLAQLFESVLNYYKLNSGILCIDPKAKLYDLVQDLDLGITHRIQGEKKIDIVVKTSKQDLIASQMPIAISGFDVL